MKNECPRKTRKSRKRKIKSFLIQTACPQCGCSAVNHLTAEEIKERFGDVPHVDMDCRECLLKYQTSMKSACPDWDRECQTQFTR